MGIRLTNSLHAEPPVESNCRQAARRGAVASNAVAAAMTATKIGRGMMPISKSTIAHLPLR
jgi:hypothetical protein